MINFLFYSSILSIVIGLAMRIQMYEQNGAVIMSLGLIGVATYFIAKLIKDIIQKQFNNKSAFIRIVLTLMSVTIFCRYMYHTFWDYPGILVVPIFLYVSIKYFFQKSKSTIILVANSLFVALTIPLFGWEFWKDPRDLIPQEWYNRFDFRDEVAITLPWSHEFKQAEILFDSAVNLNKRGQVDNAIIIYKQSLDLEQNPKTLFKLAMTLAKNNKLEKAIAYYDTLIQIDSTRSFPFNNRGLLHYKLKQNSQAISDYLAAIELEPESSTFHYNLALAYFYTNQYEMSCEEIQIAKNLGANLEDKFSKSVIKKMDCQIKKSSSIS